MRYFLIDLLDRPRPGVMRQPLSVQRWLFRGAAGARRVRRDREVCRMNVLAVGIQGGIADALADVTTFVMRLVGALAVLFVGVLVAKVVARVARRVLDRAGFNRAVDRGGIRRFLAHSRYEPSQILGKL